MARKAWIAIDGLGLLLFLLIDLWNVWYAVVPQWKPIRLGSLLPFRFMTWRTYQAMMSRINSKQDEQIGEPGMKSEGN